MPFRLSLTESFLRRVVGYVRDDAQKGGQPERGRITGHRRGRTLTFVKTMPIGYLADEDGRLVDKNDWLQRTFGIEDPRGPQHRIHYTGEFDADAQRIVGTWQIRSTVAIESEDGVHVVGGGEGTWSARRVSDLPSEV